MVELLSLLNIIRRYIWLIIITTVIATTVAFFGTDFITPIYTAKATVRILTANEGQISSPLYDTLYATQLMNTFSVIASSQQISDQLQIDLGLDYMPDFSIDALPNTELLEIEVDDPDRQIAADAANRLAELLIDNNQLLVSGDGPVSSDIILIEVNDAEDALATARANLADIVASMPEDPLEQTSIQTVQLDIARQEVQFKEDLYFLILTQYQQVRSLELVRANTVSIVERANPPRNPSSPNLELNVIIGAILGLFGGIALASVLDMMDSRLHSVKKMRDITGAKVLANIPPLPRSARDIAINTYPQGEEFRRLRFNVLSISKSNAFVVTSPEPGDGRTLIVKNLAYSLALLNRRVVIVDCDFRKEPEHSNETNEPLARSLYDLLSGKQPIYSIAENISDRRIYVIDSHPAGVNVTNIAELLSSYKMTELMNVLQDNFDYVLIDTPAFISVTDAAIIKSQLHDANVIAVLRKGKTSQESLRWMVQELQQSGAEISGVVVNHDELSHRGQFIKYYSKQSFIFDAKEKLIYEPPTQGVFGDHAGEMSLDTQPINYDEAMFDPNGINAEGRPKDRVKQNILEKLNRSDRMNQ